MDLSIVIPVFNEAENIHSLVDEIVDVLGDRPSFEIIVVDDGSTDATAAVLVHCRETVKSLRVLRHQVCSGQSAAIITGVTAAQSPLIATLDGDGQNDPADLPGLLARYRDAPADVMLVIGQRKHRHDALLKRISSRVANRVRGAILRDNTPDTGCGMKVFSREQFLALPQFDHMHRFLPALFQRQGGQVISVEVRHRPRLKGQSKYGVHNRLWAGIVDMLGVVWLQRRRKRPVVSELE